LIEGGLYDKMGKMGNCIEINRGVTMNNDERIEEKWIGIDEAAEFLGVKTSTVRDWIRKGKDIPARKIGKQWKFKCSELDEWVKSGKSAME